MSTAIMHQSALYDFGDLFLKVCFFFCLRDYHTYLFVCSDYSILSNSINIFSTFSVCLYIELGTYFIFLVDVPTYDNNI